MIINLTKSKLFTIDPDARFSMEYSVKIGLWRELWRNYCFLEYTPSDMSQLFLIRTGKHLGKWSITRWISRTRIYGVSSPLLKKGVVHVKSEIFGEYEDEVIRELTKHMKTGATKDVKSLI